MKYDFSGWATRCDLKCADNRVIRKDAFKDCDGKEVPLVWNHQHNSVDNVLGHAILENREDGVYTYGLFNTTEAGKAAKLMVEHGDITGLSIYANQLKQHGTDVVHGTIREVSLVLAGANPGAYIDQVSVHGQDVYDLEEDEAVISYVSDSLSLSHADEGEKKEEPKKEDAEKAKTDDDETVADVFNTLSEKQKTVVYAMIGAAMEHGEAESGETTEKSEGGETSMKHNVFDQTADQQPKENELSHDEFMAVMQDVKRYGSLKDSFLAHGIDQIDYLFPEAKNLNTPPDFVQRETGWVRTVMSGVHHTPFSRIKSMFADITEDDARARGYIKGNLKVEEVFGLLKRETRPTTVYKKQKLDRDDVIDITDFDVIAWLKSEMRMMLDEELARAYLIGDGRSTASNDKINEQNIRPIMKDDDLFSIKFTVPLSAGMTDDQKVKAFIRSAVKARKDYKGTGEPTLFTTEEMLINLRLIEDGIGHILYDSDAKLCSALRVKNIVAVPVMEGITGPNGGELLGIIVNLADYNVGADKGGAVSMFDDFDLDYNQQKYLIETRCSGALIKPFSAIVLESSIDSTAPTYTKVTPQEGDSPVAEGWYEKAGAKGYLLSMDTTVDAKKDYYSKS